MYAGQPLYVSYRTHLSFTTKTRGGSLTDLPTEGRARKSARGLKSMTVRRLVIQPQH